MLKQVQKIFYHRGTEHTEGFHVKAPAKNVFSVPLW